MNARRFAIFKCLLVMGVVLPLGGLHYAVAQQRASGQRMAHIGYAYPAGGQVGTSFDIVVGGQYLDGITDVIIAPLNPSKSQGQVPRATFVKLTKPLTQKQVNDLTDKLKQIQEKVRMELRQRRGRADMATYRELFVKFAAEQGISEETLKALDEYRKLRNDPKRQPNPQIAERATIHVSVPNDVPPGMYLLRLKTVNGLSDPVRFHITPWKEATEVEPNDKNQATIVSGELPLVLNGQILPGDVDRFQIQAKKGQHLVVAVLARELVPYLADAVPGWFQATLRILDKSGRELAYVDDYWFHPDPVLTFDVPADGEYVIEIKDAIYRGREDFVYRVVVGEIPYVTSVFPPGARMGETATLELQGWNLPQTRLTLGPFRGEPGIRTLELPVWAQWAHPILFAVSDWPEVREKEPNDTIEQAEKVLIGTVINGRIDRPDDRDVFRIDGKKGQRIVAEVMGRRLFSPVDSLLRILDERGTLIAVNDDYQDPSAGLLTHHADSFIAATLPHDGAYFVELTDMQHQGGPAFVYRLRISVPRPDFELRVVPSVVNASPGSIVPLHVYAVRRDGFEGGISLELGDSLPGCRLSGAWIPPGEHHVVVTLTLSRLLNPGLIDFQLRGKAVIEGRELVRTAAPAEDMMQAFYYHHLVPAERLAINVVGRSRYPFPWTFAPENAVRIPAGGQAEFRLPPGSSLFPEGTTLEIMGGPEGISLEKVSRDAGGVTLIFRAEKDKVKPGLKGNLLLAMYNEPPRRGIAPVRLQNQRFFAGWLPALPFEVVTP